jgi:hypothetical protein
VVNGNSGRFVPARVATADGAHLITNFAAQAQDSDVFRRHALDVMWITFCNRCEPHRSRGRDPR